MKEWGSSARRRLGEVFFATKNPTARVVSQPTKAMFESRSGISYLWLSLAHAA